MKHPILRWSLEVCAGRMEPEAGLNLIYTYLCNEHLKDSMLFIPFEGTTYRNATSMRLRWPLDPERM